MAELARDPRFHLVRGTGEAFIIGGQFLAQRWGLKEARQRP
jgi:hypothetical protein